MRIRTAGVIAMLIAVLLGAACTPGGAHPAPSATKGHGGSLTIWADGVAAAVLAPVAARYGKRHGLTVAVKAVEGDRQGQFLAASQSGQAPDIVLGTSDWIGNLVHHAAIEALPLSQAQKQGLAEAAVRAVSADGQVYGLPYAVQNLALIRNTDLAPLAPVTIEEAVAIGRQLQVAGKVSQVVGYPVGASGDFPTLYPLYASAGGAIFGTRANGALDLGDVTVGEPASVAAFGKIAMLGKPGSGALAPSITEENAVAAFTAQQAAYLVAGPDAITAIKKAGVRYDVSAIPPFAGGKATQPLISADAFFVASNGHNRPAARDFLSTEVLRPEVGKALYDARPRPPALTAVLDQVRASDPDAARFLDVARNGVVVPGSARMGTVWDALGRAEVAVLAGADVPATVQAATATIAAAMG